MSSLGSKQTLLIAAGLLLQACASTSGPGQPQFVPDPTDYVEFRSAIEAKYWDDISVYWGSYGLPANARLDILLEHSGQEFTDAFSMLEQEFDKPAFLSAYQVGELPAEFARHFDEGKQDGLDTWPALIHAIRATTTALDETRAELGVFAPVTEQARILGTVFAIAFPSASKSFSPSRPNKDSVTSAPDSVCQAGSTAFQPSATPTATSTPAKDDNDTTSIRRWTEITGILWDTTYNVSCVGQAVGPCAAKLGITGDGISGYDMTCKDWNDLSKALGGKPGEASGKMSDVANWFAGKGYCATTASDGPFESACEEGRKALVRGCDVLHHYTSPDNSKSHLEMVRTLDVDDNDSGKCKVYTSSWGQSATVDYDRGTYSGKSDGSRYRTADENKSYLENPGTGLFYYYCPC